MWRINLSKEVRFLIKIVKKASKLVAKNFQINEKDDKGDLVTSVDLKIEKFLIGKIKKRFPKFDIVSEEFNYNKKLSENCFTIDPIDGTVNFANGQALWGIQVACIKNGNTCASVIYLPCLKEMYYADETGAYLNGKSIHTKPLPIKNCVYVIAGENYEFKQAMYQLSKNFRYIGSVSLSCAWIASGKLSAICYVWPKHKLKKASKPWDSEPGYYLVKQAGGVVLNEDEFGLCACSQEIAEVFKENLEKINKNAS